MESLLLPLEDQAQHLISTPSIANDLTLLIILYFPFRDPAIRARLLSRRWPCYLDDILKSLPGCDISDNYTSNADKGIEILRQIDPLVQGLCGWAGRWSPPSSVSKMNPSQVAKAINAVMSVPFTLTPITELVRIALNYPSCIEQDLLNGILHMRREFCRYFGDQPEQKEFYRQMLDHLIPPAAWAVSTSLSLSNKMPHPSGALDFILPRIRTIFESDMKLDARMAQVEILEIQYTNTLQGADCSRWRELQHADLSAWHNLDFGPNKRREKVIRNRKLFSERASRHTNNGLVDEQSEDWQMNRVNGFGRRVE